MVDEFERGGFAGAAAAQEDKGFSALNFEVQIVEQFAAAVVPSKRYETLRNSMAGACRENRSCGCLTRVRACSESRMLSGQPARCRRYGNHFVCRRRQAGDANAGVAFVPDVEADQQRGDLLDDARVFQFAAVEGANAWDFCGQIAHDSEWHWDRRCRQSHRSRPGHPHSAVRLPRCEMRPQLKYLWAQLCGLLRGGALPDAECASGAAAHACG